MKQTKDKIARYTDDDFIIEIVESESEFEAWIGHSDYGFLMQMFGCPKKQSDFTISNEMFRDMVVSDLNRYKAICRKKYMES